ncbi:MAG: 3-deoxy-manno-octulosonate cytidylyltransferase [Legionellales bacterium]|nr:3-deoxy-manno-octulosonate cytidylyltransferase [Legionellales bacterium]|tara:strand:- start:512 stop:1228 length:717 start_codon:yes stop_codon:yes gene_type:complete
MNLICIIPARYGSSRLAAKMTLPIRGKAVIQHTYESALNARLFEKVIIATDHEHIESIITDIGGNVAMTPSELPCGTDRVAFVARQFQDDDIIINVQGDQPFVTKQMLEDLIKPFVENRCDTMSTVGVRVPLDQIQDPSHVKVLLNLHGHAIYFSRANIPFQMKPVPSLNVMHHIGLYAYRNDFLQSITKLPTSSLELTESLEQLRVIENGLKIAVTETIGVPLEINTKKDLDLAQLI